jgi:hypothetical protein
MAVKRCDWLRRGPGVLAKIAFVRLDQRFSVRHPDRQVPFVGAKRPAVVSKNAERLSSGAAKGHDPRARGRVG